MIERGDCLPRGHFEEPPVVPFVVKAEDDLVVPEPEAFTRRVDRQFGLNRSYHMLHAEGGVVANDVDEIQPPKASNLTRCRK